LTWLTGKILAETGVTLTGGRRMNTLETVEVDIACTASKHRQAVQAFAKRRSTGKPMVVISHDGTPNPEVHMDLETLALLLRWAVKNNEAHWARPWKARRNTDEGMMP